MQAWADGIAKPKMATQQSSADELRAAVEVADRGRMRDAYQIAGKQARGEAVAEVRQDIVAAVVADAQPVAGAAAVDADAFREQVRLTIFALHMYLSSGLESRD